MVRLERSLWLACLVLVGCGSEDIAPPEDVVEDAGASDAAALLDSSVSPATADDTAQADATTTTGPADAAANSETADAKVAADSDAAASDAAAADAAVSDAGPRVTYADVAPIFTKYCVSCHYPGGDGAFALNDYADASAHAADAYTFANARLMPPCAILFASCGPTTVELATMQAWSQDGTPQQ